MIVAGSQYGDTDSQSRRSYEECRLRNFEIAMRRILLATDAWHPQINGVVRTLEQLSLEVSKLGYEIRFITPAFFDTFPSPTNREIRIARFQPRRLYQILNSFRFDFVHIATEGPVGLMMRQYCLKNNRAFTTSYHTRLPEYVALRIPIRRKWVYRFQRWFHSPARGTMVHSPSLAAELRSWGFINLLSWSRGVDTQLFRPQNVRQFGSSQPVFLYVGRVSIEKDVDAFLKLELPGQKVVVGDGPLLHKLRRRYGDVMFTGWMVGEELAAVYASADVLVFPSKTDVFGNVILEALACGTPVAAYPVPGASDVIQRTPVGVMKEDLESAALTALAVDRRACRSYALGFSMQACAEQFLRNIAYSHGLVEVAER